MTPVKGVRVVVVDNDPAVLDLLATDLGLEGYDVVACVSSGEDAAAVCAELRPDVVVVDYRMPPGWDGLETIAHIREAQSAGAYVLYTNYRLPELRRRTERLGAVFVSKGPLRLLRNVLADLAPVDAA